MSDALEPALPDHLDEQAERRPCNSRKELKTKLDMLEQAIEEE